MSKELKRHRGFYISDVTVECLQRMTRKGENYSQALTRILHAWELVSDAEKLSAETKTLEAHYMPVKEND